MVRDVEVGGKLCTLKTSAALPRIYRLKFKRDLFNDIAAIEKKINKKKDGGEDLPIEALTTFENIAYIMHKHGDKSQPNDINTWLEQFDTFDIYMIFPVIVEMWAEENKTLSVSKKAPQK